MTPKFKIGDRVVRIRFDEEYRYIPSAMIGEGEAFIITDMDIYPDDIVYWSQWGNKSGVYEYELELESVYNSKLYKAIN